MPPAQSTVAEAIAQYVASLPAAQQLPAQQELQRFARWYGLDRVLARLIPAEIDSYISEVETSGANLAQRLQPLRAFLQEARRANLIDSNLASHVRIRRTGTKRAATSVRTEEPVIHLTAEGYERLRSELDRLIAERPAIADELARARADKDFRENAPLDAAREHQAQVEARIRELEATLRFAVVVVDERPKNGSRAGIGSTVVLRDLEFDDERTFILVSPSEVDPKRGKISIASPLGRAVLDRSVGEEVEVEAPAGILRYRIEQVEG